MTLLLARALTRIVAIAVVFALAIVGIVAAVCCIDSHGTVSLPWLAAEVHLPQFGQEVGTLLHRLQAHGPVAVVSAISGAGAILIGLGMLAATFVPRRERLVTLEQSPDGVIAARRRALAQAAVLLAERPRPVLGVSARARPWRRAAGGLLRVRIERRADTAEQEAREATTAALRPLTGSLPLQARVRVRVAAVERNPGKRGPA